MKLRIGHSKDVHRLAAGETLFLGGIELEHELGLVGHSDADVLLHAITEAIIGAMAMGDIGHFFPDNDPKYKGVDSKLLLAEVIEVMEDNGYQIANIDSTIFAERPKIGPHVLKMRTVVADICKIALEDINIKATRGEKIGSIGREEGMGAEAVVLLIKE
ncbi:2-C-methyl-D-erythritol 2,4-cyclodiphosphate synthase [Mollicutes bacterium LVI A0039]|nr:2-C-methyl-D-erythritol 2,4-cyclodiphosphate synthase [Mollicutes bacterium LVI A0039]